MPSPSRCAHYNKVRAETGYRSGLEVQIAESIQGVAGVFYEPFTIPYVVPSTHTYKPDFVLSKQALIIEGKGEFTTTDRRKMLLVKAQHPDLDIRFVFSNPNNKIGKKSKTTYGMWCDKAGFPWFKGIVPAAWLKHVPSGKQKKALDAFMAEYNGKA